MAIARTPFLDIVRPSRQIRLRHKRFPEIQLVPSNEFRALEALDVAVRRLLPVVIVIGDDRGGVARTLQQFRQTKVEGFERAPRTPLHGGSSKARNMG